MITKNLSHILTKIPPKRFMKAIFATIIMILSGLFIGYLQYKQEGLQKIVFKAEIKEKKDNQAVLDEFTRRWSAQLRKYVDSNGHVSYRKWKDSDLLELDKLVGLLAHLDVGTLNDKEAMCFYINLYNFLTVRAILEFYPLKSIKDYVSPIGFNIWKNVFIKLHNREISLDQIEHEILRKMGEPRIHFAIVCASIGCPKMHNEAFTPERLEEQLVMQARHFFDQEQNLEFDLEKNELQLSSIIKWFSGDFGRDEIAMLETLDGYLSPELKAKLKQPLSDFESVSYLDYDWNLNGR